MKKLSFYGLVVFFVLAGLNHFVNPAFYLPLIPDYIPYHDTVNVLSGVLEIGFGLALLWPAMRRWAAFALILLMISFIPSHVYFIQMGGCIPDGLCAPVWVGWVRLLVIHQLLVYWIYANRNVEFGK